MADETMKIEVPISIKGGREGDKVGKQIGNQIAKALNKSLKSVGFGGTKSSAGGGVSQAAGLFSAMSKGISGVAVKLGVVGVTLGATLGILKKSSGYLRGVLSMFERSFMIFFRPFGDFLATLLRPLAIILMKAAVGWLKWTRESATGKALFGGGEDTTGSKAVKTGLKSVLPGGFAFGGILGSIRSAILEVDWGSFGTWLFEKAKSMWDSTWSFSSWLWDKITSIWDWGERNLGLWLWNKITDSLGNLGSFFGFGKDKGSSAKSSAPIFQNNSLATDKILSGVDRSQEKRTTSLILQPTIQMMGGGSSSDADDLATRFVSMTMQALKSRGIL